MTDHLIKYYPRKYLDRTNIKKINQINNRNRYLIDYANLKMGLIKYQKVFLDKKSFDFFCKRHDFGFHLVVPVGLKYFTYS